MNATTEETPPNPPAWTMIESTYSDYDTNFELVVMCKHRRFIISLSAENFSSSASLKGEYLFFLDVAEHCELNGVTIEDFYDWIVEPLLPVFQELPEIKTGDTLHDFLFMEILTYTLRADGDAAIALPLENDEHARSLFGVQLSDNICEPWPLYEPRDVQIRRDITRPGPPSTTPSRVALSDGSLPYLKLCRGGDKKSAEREIDTYRRIRSARLDETLHIPRLLGLVRTGNGHVFGLLLTYIDCRHRTLRCASKKETPTDLKQKWALQVTNAVEQLHKAGIAWGDVKPENVLIDHNEDAWIIDFGEGYTKDWVPKELSGTMEGDVKGLERITEFLA